MKKTTKTKDSPWGTSNAVDQGTMVVSGKIIVHRTNYDQIAKMITKMSWVCAPCGISANVLTCLKKYGKPPKTLSFSMSTYHIGKCSMCKELKPVTQPRDFFHPDFSLLLKAMNKKKRRNEKLQKKVS